MHLPLIFNNFWGLFNHWWLLLGFLIIPIGWVQAALAAAPAIISALGSLFGGKKKETEYTSGLSKKDQAFRDWLQGQIQGMASTYRSHIPQIPQSFLDAQALLYKRYGLGAPPIYRGLGISSYGQPSFQAPAPQIPPYAGGGIEDRPIPSYAFGGIADRPQIARIAERGPEAIIPLGTYDAGERARPQQQMNLAGGQIGYRPPSLMPSIVPSASRDRAPGIWMEGPIPRDVPYSTGYKGPTQLQQPFGLGGGMGLQPFTPRPVTMPSALQATVPGVRMEGEIPKDVSYSIGYKGPTQLSLSGFRQQPVGIGGGMLNPRAQRVGAGRINPWIGRFGG